MCGGAPVRTKQQLLEKTHAACLFWQRAATSTQPAPLHSSRVPCGPLRPARVGTTTSVRQRLPPTLPDPTTPSQEARPAHELAACVYGQAGGRWRPVSRRVPCVLCEAKRHATMHVAPLCDSPIQQRPRGGSHRRVPHSQPLPEPSTRDLPCCPPSLRAPCVLREVLEAATMDLSSLCHCSIQQRGLVLPRGRGHCPVGAARPFWRIHRTTRKLALLLAMSSGRMPFTS